MWQAIDAAVPAELPAIQLPSRGVIFRFLSATGAVAACLFIAFMLGEQRYGSMPTLSTLPNKQHTPDMSQVGSPVEHYANENTAKSEKSLWMLLRESGLTRRASTGWSFEQASPDEPQSFGNFSDSPDTSLAGAGSQRFIYESRYEPSSGPTDAMRQFLADEHKLAADLRSTDQSTLASASAATNSTLPSLQAGYLFTGGDTASPSSPTLASASSPSEGATTALNFLCDRDVRLDANGDGVDYHYSAGAFDASTSATAAQNSQGDRGALHTADGIDASASVHNYFADQGTPPASQDLQESESTAGRNLSTADPEVKTTERGFANTLALPAKSAEADTVVGLQFFNSENSKDPTESDQFTFDNDGLSNDWDTVWLKERYNRLDRWHAGDTIVASAGQPGQTDQTPQPAEAQPQNAQAAPTAQPRPQSTKVIKTGSLATEVEDYENALHDVSEILARFDCFLADASTKETAGGALVGELIVRVSPAHFESLFAALRQIGRLESEDIKSADVTAEYVDIEARIAALKVTEDRLIELVKSKSFVDRMEDLLKVEQEMNRVRTEIEQNEGRLRVMADRVALSTIAMTLREPARTVPSASISVEVPVLDAAAAALGETLVSLDARLVSGKVTQLEKGALVGDYRVKVSLARFGDALAAIAHLGRVEARDVRDWREQSATAKWADRVTCDVALKLFERSRDLPSGTMSVQVESLPKALAALDELLPTGDAAVTSNRTSKRNDGSSTADLQVRIPAGEFAALVGKLDALGRVTARQLAGEAGSIAGGAADTPCALSLTLAEPVRQIPSGGMLIEVQTFADARDRLADLVGKHAMQVLASNSSQRTDGTWIGQFQLGITASGIDTAVAELEKLGKVSSREIRGIGLGELSKIDANALGVLEIILAEKSAINPGAEGNTIRSYLRDGLTGLYASLGLIAYGLVVMAPWLIIALIAGWLITRIWKRRKAAVCAKPRNAAT